MTKTIPMSDVGKISIGYGVGAYISKANQKIITNLLDQLTKELPDILWPMPADLLHITLFEIVVSSSEYSRDRDALYEEHRAAIEQELDRVFRQVNAITIEFNQLVASTAAIIVKGRDDGTMQKIRDGIVDKGLLPSETKQPPDIIHTSIARYLQEADLERLQKVLRHHAVRYKQIVHEFRLEKASGPYMSGIEMLKVYPLNGGWS